MWSISTTSTIILFVCLFVVALSQEDKPEIPVRSCEVEAVFRTPDKRYYAVERSVQHDMETGVQDYTSHVATWSEWESDFPVMNKTHEKLPRSVEVFPEGISYVTGAMVDHREKVVVAYDYRNSRVTSPVGPNDRDQEVIREYDYKDGMFHHVRHYNLTEYFPYIGKLAVDEGLNIRRVMAMSYISGEKGKKAEYVVHLWTLNDRWKENEGKEFNLYLQIRMSQDRKQGTFDYLKTANDYHPNLLHVKYPDEKDYADEKHAVIDGSYGIWRHYTYSQNDKIWKPEIYGPWHLDDPLLGCPQNLCVDADVDAIANTPNEIFIFRGCYYWHVTKSNADLPGRLQGAELISSGWKTERGDPVDCNVHAAFYNSEDQKIYIFREKYFWICEGPSGTCPSKYSLTAVFPGMSEKVEAATMDSKKRVWLLSRSQSDFPTDKHRGRLQYAVYRIKNYEPTILAEDVTSEEKKDRFVNYKFPYLPDRVDDMMTVGPNIIFFTESHYFNVSEDAIDSGQTVKPVHTAGDFFQCDNGIYATLATLNVRNVHQYYTWRKPPPPAPPLPRPEIEHGNDVDYLWLLLLLLLLIPICCFIPCRKSRQSEDPQSKPESVFARSAMGSVLSALRPDNDLRSSISSVSSNQPFRTPGSTRSGMSNTSAGGPAGGLSGKSGASRSALSNPSGGSRTPASPGGSSPGLRSAMTGSPSGGAPSSGSRRSGLSDPSAGGGSAASRPGVSGAGSRSGMSSNPSGGSPATMGSGAAGSGPGSRSGMTGTPSGGAPSSGSRRSGLSDPSAGGASSGSTRSGMANASGPSPNASAQSRSGLSNSPSSGNQSDNSKRSKMSNPSNK
jgi:hypothetical protein